MPSLTQPPINFQERIRSAVAETLGLSYADIVAQIIHLRVTLDGDVTTDSDTYRMPGDYGFLGWEMHAHLAMNSISTEPTLGTDSGSTSVLEFGGLRERALLKAMNCKYQVVNPDAAGPLPIVDGEGRNSSGQNFLDTRLSVLWKDAGGAPVEWCRGNDVMPLIVGPLDRLKGTFTLVNSEDTRLNVQTEYGIALWGCFIRADAI